VCVCVCVSVCKNYKSFHSSPNSVCTLLMAATWSSWRCYETLVLPSIKICAQWPGIDNVKRRILSDSTGGQQDFTPRQLHLLFPFNDLFSRSAWVGRYQKGKTSLDLNEARDDGVWGCIGIICKQSAPRYREISTPTPHQSIFPGRMLFLTPNQQCQSTEDTSTSALVVPFGAALSWG